MRVLSLFSGIGAFEKALDNLEAPYELVGYCEIDKYASKSYSAIHGCSESMNLGDITKVDEKALPKDIDLITYGFPCQDISLAWEQQGLFNEDGSKTRSGLFFEALRIIEETQPRVAIAENVKNLTGKRFTEQFKIVLDSLKAAGYNNYWKVLNAKDYGVPQNRERVFIVSIRKDIDTGAFKFPEGFPLELRLKDVLDAEVDEKYYCSEIALNGFKEHAKKKREKGNSFHAVFKDVDDIASTLKARYYKDGSDCLVKEPCVKQIGNLMPTKTRDNPNQGRLYDKEGLSPTLGAMQGGNRQPFIVNGYIRKDGCVGTIMTDGSSPKKNNRVLVWDGFNQRVRADQSCVGTLTRNCGADLKRNGQWIIESALRIRKLTPKECFRLMGFDDSDFEKAEAVNSNTQLYKQAGNSIVVPVVEYIIEALFDCGALIKEGVKEYDDLL